MDSRPKFFSTTKKGENAELKVELNSEYRDKRKEAVKKVIANMTIGKDVSPLFADVVKNMQTEDLALKKLVYLYLMNYARTQPELVILVVNTFVKDSDDPSPLIRALAIRTMGCLRSEKIIDYLMEPLKKGLKDNDPYVRKTAAICVAKVFDLSPNLAVDNGLIEMVQEMLSDKNPMVIANAVSSLQEISESAARNDIFTMNSSILLKLVTALNECTEWGQICILGSLANYKPSKESEAADIVERVLPRLQHANASLVLSAVKVLLVYMPYISNNETLQTIVRKLSPPLVSLISSQPELQYVALRNINLILQKIPDALNQEVRIFFIKYTDPPYVKMEKLETIIKLCSERNLDQVLSELKEYSSEVDIEFVKKSIRAIGVCAIKIEAAADKCINLLMELLKTKVEHVVQEAIIVIKDIFRKYPRRYEAMIPDICDNLESLDEPEAKASLVWIIGEYADRIPDSEQLLSFFAENFKDEDVAVQIQVLTSIVKLFLKKPGSGQQLVQNVLQLATQSNENPHVRDRAYLFWRLLSSSQQLAQSVVLADKPSIQIDGLTVCESLLDELIYNLGSMASVYHISPKSFGYSSLEIKRGDLQEEDKEFFGQEAPAVTNSQGFGGIDNLLDLDFEPTPTQNTPAPASSEAPDFFSLDFGLPSAVSATMSAQQKPSTNLGFPGASAAMNFMNAPMSATSVPANANLNANFNAQTSVQTNAIANISSFSHGSNLGTGNTLGNSNVSAGFAAAPLSFSSQTKPSGSNDLLSMDFSLPTSTSSTSAPIQHAPKPAVKSADPFADLANLGGLSLGSQKPAQTQAPTSLQNNNDFDLLG